MAYGIQSQVPSGSILLAFDNLALGTAGATVSTYGPASGGNLQSGNLLTAALDEAWRSGSISDWYALNVDGPGPRSADSTNDWRMIRLRFALARPSIVDTVILQRTNVRCRWRSKFYRGNPANGASPAVHDTDWLDPVVRSALSDWEWPTSTAATFLPNSMPWTLGPTEQRLDELTDRFRLDQPHQLTTPLVGITHVDILFDVEDGTNGGASELKAYQPADYLQVSNVFIGRAFRPRINMTHDWEHAPEDLARIERTDAGAAHGRTRARLRAFAFNLDSLDDDEALETILDSWLMRHGTLGRVWVWPVPGQRRFFYQTAFTGTLQRMGKVTAAKLDWLTSKGFVIVETN